jgi:hypothetical protein
MGTRADFYIGRGKDAEWLGSICWDGYPDGTPKVVLDCKTEQDFRVAVETIPAGEGDDFTAPEQGWPWPWDDSNTTDYAYAFEDGEVYYTVGYTWHKHSDGPQPEDEPEGPRAVFPNMKERKNVRMGKGSGIMIIGKIQ